ncbi:putative LRR receptor-like serine/threonine-protein kinase isoform X8 [Cinnamomum micranthum f. kanehirae]|uniref:Putative LRR receptor-like serine/threonine-protein kinase isoform X8 n=1 Tax=Cinnamomum micranthum f. kanehirae TaxID=337451 RepID=A0A443N6K3_9MAGN|nr:putative LRR receptor-like serine/threonine-protein kinase isoform X8 [Cinnamomum micranthum f. kanehirae]
MFLRISKIAIFLMQIWCYYFYCCHGCLEEERTHLLQIKDSINYPHGSSLDKDWVGKNCCKWSRIRCNPSSFRVTSINLKLLREERLGIWHPNASLFAPFKELEALTLKENQIGGWVVPQAFSKMQSLRHINLDHNNLSTSIDSLRDLCELKNLRSLYLRNNNLDGRAFSLCLSNLSMLEKLLLWGNNLGFYSGAPTGIK